MIPFLCALFFQAAAGGELIGLETEQVGDRTRYTLEFDGPVAVYYPRKSENAFRLDLYGVSPGRGMEEKISALEAGNPWSFDSLPLPLLTLNLPLPAKARAETFPVGNLLLVETVAENDERIWSLPRQEAPAGLFPCLGMVLYRREGAEELCLTLPENAAHTSFRSTAQGCRVEIFGPGLFLEEKTLPVESRFISQVHQSAMSPGPLSPEGLCIFDFDFKKKARVSHRFLPLNLVVRLDKP